MAFGNCYKLQSLSQWVCGMVDGLTWKEFEGVKEKVNHFHHGSKGHKVLDNLGYFEKSR